MQDQQNDAVLSTADAALLKEFNDPVVNHAMLAEEACEVAQQSNKFTRFEADFDCGTGDGGTPLRHLIQEMGDYEAMKRLICAQYGITTAMIEEATQRKYTKMRFDNYKWYRRNSELLPALEA